MTSRPSDSHRILASRMAETAGVDLTRARRLGQVSADEVSDLFQSCSRCSAWQECPSWMEAHADTPTRAPGYCRNRNFFDEVRLRKAALG